MPIVSQSSSRKAALDDSDDDDASVARTCTPAKPVAGAAKNVSARAHTHTVGQMFASCKRKCFFKKIKSKFLAQLSRPTR